MDARASLEDRSRKVREIRSLLSEDSIESLTEPDFRKIIASLWAFVGWTNKDYIADRVLAYKYVEEVKSELR